MALLIPFLTYHPLLIMEKNDKFVFILLFSLPQQNVMKLIHNANYFKILIKFRFG